jgi:hypothetical protein
MLSVYCFYGEQAADERQKQGRQAEEEEETPSSLSAALGIPLQVLDDKLLFSCWSLLERRLQNETVKFSLPAKRSFFSLKH